MFNNPNLEQVKIAAKMFKARKIQRFQDISSEIPENGGDVMANHATTVFVNICNG